MNLRTKILFITLSLVIALETTAIVVLATKVREFSVQAETDVIEEAIEESLFGEPIGEHVLTFYTHTGYRTASGVYPKAGRTVAVDTRFIPHGTVLYIEGIGIRVAEDTGGDIKGNRLDVFVDTKQEAIQKGVKKAKVYKVKNK